MRLQLKSSFTSRFHTLTYIHVEEHQSFISGLQLNETTRPHHIQTQK